MSHFTLIFLTIVFSAAAKAAGPIVDCHGTSPRFPGFEIILTESPEGKLASLYTLGHFPLSPSPWTNPGEITTPPVSFPRLLEKVNQQHDTGLRTDQVAFFQMIFIDGSDHWDVELWKLMDANGGLLGWMAYAYGEPIGCLTDGRTAFSLY